MLAVIDSWYTGLRIEDLAILLAGLRRISRNTLCSFDSHINEQALIATQVSCLCRNAAVVGNGFFQNRDRVVVVGASVPLKLLSCKA